MKKKIILFGNGGQASVVEDTLKKTGHVIYSKIYIKGNKLYDSKLKKFIQEKYIFKNYKNFVFHLAIGDLSIRGKILKKFKNKLKFVSIISKYATISNKSKIESGTYISEKSIVKNDVLIGENSLINTGAIIEHHCRIGKNVHIGPGVILCGNVQISNNTFLGAGTIVVNDIKIKKKKFIKAGSLIKKNI